MEKLNLFIADVTPSHGTSFSLLHLSGKLDWRRRGEEGLEEEEEEEEGEGREGMEEEEEEEGHILPFVPSPPTPQELRSNFSLQTFVNVFHFFNFVLTKVTRIR